MNSTDSIKNLLAASGGDTVKLFDVSLEPRDPCILSYIPSPGVHVNSVKWNHTNLVVASAGDGNKISLWSKNGQSLGTLHNDGADYIEEPISAINFSNKASRYICSGGSGQVVRIWDLQRKRCIKWLKGHTDTITGVIYNCKDEHLASISLNGNLILHNLFSGAKATELKDPNGQVLRVLDYSKISRHLLVTAGDDGSIHLWDTTGRSPKVSWLNQHSAPISGIGISPSNDKIVASVGMDKKLYAFDSGSRRSSFCIPYEAPFSSLAFTDDGFTLAAGTSSGRVVFYDIRGKPQPLTVLRAYGNSEAVTSLCWQRSKPVMVNENNCTPEMALLGSAVEGSILMPDPLPAMVPSSQSTSLTRSGSRTTALSGSVDSFSIPASSSRSTSGTVGLPMPEETPIRSSLWKGGSLARLLAPRNFKDDMEVFSPLVEVQQITPSLDKLWDDYEGFNKDLDKRLFPSSLRCHLPVESGNDNNPIFDWKSSSLPKQGDCSSSLAQLSSTTISSRGNDSSSVTPPEAWGGERLSDRLAHLRQSGNMPSRFSVSTSGPLAAGTMFSGSQDTFPATQSIGSLMSSSLTLANLRIKDNLNEETSLGSSEHLSCSSTSFPVGTKGIRGQGALDSLGSTVPLPQRFSNYAGRISTTPSFSDGTLSVGSPNTKKTGTETREEFLNSLLSKSDKSSATAAGVFQAMNGEINQPQNPTLPELQQGSSYMLQPIQHTVEESPPSSQMSNHEDIRNLHLELLRQFHMHEMKTARRMNLIYENQVELMKEIKSVGRLTQQLLSYIAQSS